ncbi:MAG TPA: hypothetical protein PLM74_00645, partial [Bacillota bacterium]|nr:hypothetical protein [Bacillota bacterium]
APAVWVPMVRHQRFPVQPRDAYKDYTDLPLDRALPRSEAMGCYRLARYGPCDPVAEVSCDPTPGWGNGGGAVKLVSKNPNGHPVRINQGIRGRAPDE